MTPVREVLDQFVDDANRDRIDWDAVEAALLVREDNMADQIRLAGMQFGAFPEFVAEVLAQTGLGTPPTTEERALLHSQFHVRMEWLQEQMRQQGLGDDNDNGTSGI